MRVTSTSTHTSRQCASRAASSRCCDPPRCVMHGRFDWCLCDLLSRSSSHRPGGVIAGSRVIVIGTVKNAEGLTILCRNICTHHTSSTPNLPACVPPLVGDFALVLSTPLRHMLGFAWGVLWGARCGTGSDPFSCTHADVTLPCRGLSVCMAHECRCCHLAVSYRSTC